MELERRPFFIGMSCQEAFIVYANTVCNYYVNKSIAEVLKMYKILLGLIFSDFTAKIAPIKVFHQILEM